MAGGALSPHRCVVPAPGAGPPPGSWKTSREGYRLLFQGAQRAELRYRAAAQNNPDPVLGDLFRALAAESAREQRQLLQLLSQ